jgi:hypothetical protein
MIHKKLRFDDNISPTNTSNDWTNLYAEQGGYLIANNERPYFDFASVSATGKSNACRYSPDHNVFAYSTSLKGLQFFHFPHLDQCLQRSIEIDVTNPTVYNYLENALNPSGEKLTVVPNTDGAIAYTDGASATWATVSGRKQIDRDGVTEGFLEWTGITGMIRVGAHIIKDDTSGGMTITVTDTTDAVILTDWNAVDVNLYHAEASVEDPYVVWITLPDCTHKYTVKIEHSGVDNAGANDYLTIQQFFTVAQITGNIKADLWLKHTDHVGTTFSYLDIVDNDTQETDKTQTFTANGSDTEFTLTGNNRAGDVVAFGQKATAESEITWFTPNSVDLVWGTNNPDYDDEIIDSDGYVTVKWATAPASGNAYIKYTPKADKAWLDITLEQPNDGASFIDNRINTRLLDYALELL